MKTFEIITNEVELCYYKGIYIVNAETEAEAMEIVKSKNVDRIESEEYETYDYGEFDKQVAIDYAKGLHDFISIQDVKKVKSESEKRKEEINQAITNLQKRMEELKNEINSIK